MDEGSFTSKEKFFNQLNELIKELNLPVNKIASILEVHTETLRCWKQGIKTPRPRHRVKYLNKLRCFLGRSELPDESFLVDLAEKQHLDRKSLNKEKTNFRIDEHNLDIPGITTAGEFRVQFIELRNQLKLPYTELCPLIGVTADTIRFWIDGRQCPRPRERVEILNILRINLGLPLLKEEMEVIHKLFSNENRKTARKEKLSKDPDYLRRNTARHIERLTATTEGMQSLLHYRAKSRSKEMGYEFSILPEDIPINTVCPILGIDIKCYTGTFTGRHAKRNSISIDRIDSSLGYIPGNVDTISSRANTIKRDATFDELIALGEWAKKEKAKRNK